MNLGGKKCCDAQPGLWALLKGVRIAINECRCVRAEAKNANATVTHLDRQGGRELHIAMRTKMDLV